MPAAAEEVIPEDERWTEADDLAPPEPGVLAGARKKNVCGKERWDVKSLTDDQAVKVKFSPVSSSVKQLGTHVGHVLASQPLDLRAAAVLVLAMCMKAKNEEAPVMKSVLRAVAGLFPVVVVSFAPMRLVAAELDLARHVPANTTLGQHITIYHDRGALLGGWAKAGTGRITNYSSTGLEVEGDLDYTFLLFTLKGKFRYAVTGAASSNLSYDVLVAERRWSGVAPWSAADGVLLAAKDGISVSQTAYGDASRGIEVRVQFGATDLESVLLRLEY